ncbi:hypothetical protein EMPG_15941 [Blastomyces silverae]|uniref:Uncharacterized protein n=1 Tax=Blastomyces silverae TaxID=2060906 RepID=A0A0H1BHG7_9EURO|nr:hypothetical protein EMPG_15941 [Blastomyces silverae]
MESQTPNSAHLQSPVDDQEGSIPDQSERKSQQNEEQSASGNVGSGQADGWERPLSDEDDMV